MPEKCPICNEAMCSHTKNEREIARLTRDVQMLEGAINGWREETDRLREENEKLKREKHAAHVEWSNFMKTIEERNRLRAEVEDFRKAYNKKSVQLLEQDKAVRKLNAEVAALKAENERLKAEVERLRREIAECGVCQELTALRRVADAARRVERETQHGPLLTDGCIVEVRGALALDHKAGKGATVGVEPTT